MGRELVESYGGVAKPLGLVPGLSTSQIVARIYEAEQCEIRRAG